jgi:hypothetical protein
MKNQGNRHDSDPLAQWRDRPFDPRMFQAGAIIGMPWSLVNAQYRDQTGRDLPKVSDHDELVAEFMRLNRDPVLKRQRAEMRARAVNQSARPVPTVTQRQRDRDRVAQCDWEFALHYDRIPESHVPVEHVARAAFVVDQTAAALRVPAASIVWTAQIFPTYGDRGTVTPDHYTSDKPVNGWTMTDRNAIMLVWQDQRLRDTEFVAAHEMRHRQQMQAPSFTASLAMEADADRFAERWLASRGYR